MTTRRRFPSVGLEYAAGSSSGARADDCVQNTPRQPETTVKWVGQQAVGIAALHDAPGLACILSRLLPASLLLLGLLPTAAASRELLPLIADAELAFRC